MKIVLVHGIMNNGKVFFKMKKELENAGHKCFTPNLKPADGRTGLDDLANKLKTYIDSNIPKNEKFILVGFSMGGLVSRYYLQRVNGYKNVLKFISIATPHSGTIMAYLFYGKGVKQMRPQSKFLESLNESEYLLDGIETINYYTVFDLTVFPYTNSIWEYAKNEKFYFIMHWLMIFNNKVISNILKNIKLS